MVVTESIKVTAKRYGKWCNEGNGIGYPAIQPFLREAKMAQYGVPILDDKTAMKVHDCTLIMRKVTPELYQVFMLRFVARKSSANICREMEIKDTLYRQYLFAALQSLKLLMTESKCFFLA